MIDIFLEPKEFTVEGPNPRAKYKTYMIQFRDRSALVRIKLTPEQFEAFSSLCAELRRSENE